MRNIASKLALAAVLAAGLAGPAFADVEAVASINKTKDVSVSETISITKTIDITVTVNRDLNASAQASAIVNAGIHNDLVDRNVPEELSNLTPTDNSNDTGAIIRAAAIDGTPVVLGGPHGSVNNNIGVTGVNQDVGDMTNQGNIWSVAFSDDGGSLFTDAQSEVSQSNTNNTVSFVDETGGRNQQVLFTASIDSSINGNEGITSVNQNAGNMNNQTNAVAAAAGLQSGTSVAVGGATVALAEAALGQENTNNHVTETTVGQGDGTNKEADIFASINNNTGITQVNQSVGNIGNQGNVVAVGAAIIGLTP